MKSGKPQKAPKVLPPPKGKPNVMKEMDKVKKGKSPMAPMTGKKLSK